MNKLTKEQIGMFTAIAVIVMLVAFFFVKVFGSTAIDLLSYTGWFGTITLILAMLAPIYTLLYAFRDQKVLEPLKPIFVLKPALAYALPLIALALVGLGAFFDGGWAVILYAAGAVCAYCIGQNDK